MHLKDSCLEDGFNEIKELVTLATNKEEICAATLCLFYSGKFSQTQLTCTLELLNILSDENIPITFNSCAKVLLNKSEDAVEFQKEFYCSVCNVVLVKSTEKGKKSRNCIECNEK